MSGSRSLPRSAEVVIIGGGVIGLSIAWHLAGRGMTDVVVLEREEIGSGATRFATGGIRQQFATEPDVRLSLESVRFYEQFEERVGLPFLFRQAGYLFLSSDEAQFATMRDSAAMQQRLDVPAEVLTPEEISARWPQIRVDDLVGATFCATDGSGSPTDVAYAFARRARDKGVTVLEGVEFSGIDVESGQVTGVQTSAGSIASGTVVICAGPWSGEVGKLAGVEIPVFPHPRQAFSVSPVAELGDHFPFTIDLATGVYVHQDPSGIVLGGGDRARPSSFDQTIDWSRFDYVVECATRRVPTLEEARSLSGWCGTREMTPDDHAILGPVGDARGLWCASGFSGHGFMHAPAAGRIMAEWLLTGAPPAEIDVSSFVIDRFASGTTEQAGFVF
jgi:sarcosine oxidase, subunit beta